MSVRQVLVARIEHGCTLCMGAVVVLLILGIGGCATPLGSGAKADPYRAETMQEFVGLPRPS